MAEKNKADWQDLVEKYLNNSISQEELEQLLQKAASSGDEEMLTSLLKEEWDPQTSSTTDRQAAWENKFRAMMNEAGQVAPAIPLKRPTGLKWMYRVAAAAVLVIAVATFFVLFNKPAANDPAAAQAVAAASPDLLPGKNIAVLTLADGSAIVLDDAKNGELAEQGNTRVIKLADGQLAYDGIAGKKSGVVYNTMTTPKGGQYQLRLPDGSRVWLNAASSIRYPTSFEEKERKVEITGEAYFEVASMATKPFKVKVQDIEVKVLGTHFNVNAYADEASIQTTLLEGSVKISKGTNEKLLKPGQQAQWKAGGNLHVVNDVDIDAVMAWKNGYFSFDNTDMAAVMRQLSRWYDVDIVYEGKVPDRKFGGEISRHSNASKVLKILEESKVKFRIEGKKIIVLP